MLLNKFRGSLVGVLVGDCLGGPFEGVAAVVNSHINTYFSQMLDPKLRCKFSRYVFDDCHAQECSQSLYIAVPFKPYTDDTIMTKQVAESLIQNGGFDAQDMAKKYALLSFHFRINA
jgi:poly(ADP-ribose) glycohydrolase ARH3